MNSFLTENKLKSLTVVLGNVDYKLIQPIIKTNAEMWIHPILGTHFYSLLKDKFNNQSLDANEEVIVGYIQQSLAWRTATDLVISTSAQMTNKGPQEQYGMNSSQASITKLGMLTDSYQSKARHFESQLVNYLHNNKGFFPGYTDKLNNDCTIFLKPVSECSSRIGNSGIDFL